jgi:hypothetical protein
MQYQKAEVEAREASWPEVVESEELEASARLDFTED